MLTEKEFLKLLGSQIARLRRSKGYSQDRLYLEGGFSRGTASKIENGRVSSQIYTLYRIAETIGVPLERLVSLESKNRVSTPKKNLRA